MASEASFIFGFVSDFYDLLPKEDRDLIAVYWHALTQIVADLYQESFETALGNVVNDVTLYKTERWNAYEMTSETTTMSSKTDSLALSGIVGSQLSSDAVLFDSISVTNTSGSIFYSETVTLVEDTVVELRYGSIVRDTVRVSEGSAQFIEGRDFNFNYSDGKIQRIADAGIPNGTTVTVSYMHPTYERNVDYTVDEVYRKVARTADSQILDGQTVKVSYNHLTKVADNLSGTGKIDGYEHTLTDSTKNFSGVLPGRTVTITSGVNAGTYTVSSVLSSVTIKIAETFVATDTVAQYRINAFPYAITVGSTVSSVPTMQDRIVDPQTVWREDVDYIVGNGKISFRVALPQGFSDPVMWAEETLIDDETVYKNFGVLIDFYRASSEEYLNAVRGLWYTYWTGSTHENLKRGLHILLGLPFATAHGTVTNVQRIESLNRDVSSGADLTPPSLRLLPTSPTDSITSATKTFVFTAASDPISRFSFDDIGRTIRITGSSAGNDGFYTIASLVSLTAITVAEDVPADEAAGFSGRIHEPMVVDGQSNVTHFSYDTADFTYEDIGRTLRIESLVQRENSGDYEILEVISKSKIRCSPFALVEGPGGFSANIYDSEDSYIEITDESGIVREYEIPTGLQSLVEQDDAVTPFQRLTTGIEIYDKNNSANFVELKVGRRIIQKFLTQYAGQGTGADTDETKALSLLVEHLFMVQTSAEAVSETVNLTEINTFLENLKPQWTEAVFAFAAKLDESFSVGEDLDASDISLTLDLTTIIRNSWRNISQISQVAYQGTGSIETNTVRQLPAGCILNFPCMLDTSMGGGFDFSQADVGRYIEVVGSGSGNDNRYTIKTVLDADTVIVSPDFVTDEVLGSTIDLTAMVKITDSSATFTSDVSRGDTVFIEQGNNAGHYRVFEVSSDTVLIIEEKDFDGPFGLIESDRAFQILSQSWNLDRDAVNVFDWFLVYGIGAIIDSTTFEVGAEQDLIAAGVQPGFLLTITAGDNMDTYPIVSVDSAQQITVGKSFPSLVADPQTYSISQAALVVTDITATIQDAQPLEYMPEITMGGGPIPPPVA